MDAEQPLLAPHPEAEPQLAASIEPAPEEHRPNSPPPVANTDVDPFASMKTVASYSSADLHSSNSQSTISETSGSTVSELNITFPSTNAFPSRVSVAANSVSDTNMAFPSGNALPSRLSAPKRRNRFVSAPEAFGPDYETVIEQPAMPQEDKPLIPLPAPLLAPDPKPTSAPPTPASGLASAASRRSRKLLQRKSTVRFKEITEVRHFEQDGEDSSVEEQQVAVQLEDEQPVGVMPETAMQSRASQLLSQTENNNQISEGTYSTIYIDTYR